MSEATPPEPLKPGDVVTLQSGGPPMTVVKVPADPAAPDAAFTCFWMDEEGAAVSEHTFPAAALCAAGHAHPAARAKGKK
jgi:uncharacterized protein YodC (DUF2158 family)